VKYAFMAQCREEFPVVLTSRALSVSRAGFYAWLKREPAADRRRLRHFHRADIEQYAAAVARARRYARAGDGVIQHGFSPA